MLSDGVIALHEITPAEAQDLAEGRCPLPAVPDYPHSDSMAAARLARDSFWLDNWVPGFGMHLIVRLADGLVVGDAGFHAPPDERGSVELSYGLAASARGHGYATRAVRLLCASALARDCASSVIAETTPDNPASIAVLARCGFVPVRSGGQRLRFRLSRGPR
ncbi:MAG: GNAT family N-acetyltransferase [Propionibacteriaceae bacterium]|nr:GNAT family N-acetyltransferase [Propionibacteriaceae bacterium]